MSRMNRVLFTAGALLMLVSSAAMAFIDYPNPVRVTTLTGGDYFNSNFITDSNDAYSWFGRIYRNADHVRVTWEPYYDGQYGDGSAQGFGFIKSEEGYGAYMLHLQRGYNSYYGPRDVYDEYNHFTLGYGYPFGSFDLGVVYNRQSTSWTHKATETDFTEDPDEVTTTESEYSEAYNTFGLGITYDMDDETVIDAMFSMQMGSEDDGESDVTLVDFPGDTPDYVVDDIDFERTGFMLGARAFRAMREDLTIIPVFTFGTSKDTYGSFGADSDAPYLPYWQESEAKSTGFAGGIGFDYTVNESNDVYLFASIQRTKYEWDSTTYYPYFDGTDLDGNGTYVWQSETTYTAMPGVACAVEHELTDMFTIRMGASKNWWTRKSTSDSESFDDPETGDNVPYGATESENEDSDYPWQFTLGMGIAMGDWVIDLSLNESWLYSAGYWFHGYESKTSPIAQIEAKLWF